jgi:ATP-dependent DNA helicase RecG
MGLMEDRGRGRGHRYHLSSAFYRVANDRSAYIRVKGAEPAQQGQMILNYAVEYGKITRREAAELCLVEASEARQLLTELVSKGKLQLHGQKRGAYYTPVI